MSDSIERARQTQPNEHLNAAQLAQVTKHVAEFVKDMKIRQWCIEQAEQLMKYPLANKYNDPIDLASAVYKFITKDVGN